MRIAVLVCSLVFDSQKAFMKGIERRVRDCGDTASVFSCHVNIAGEATYSKGEYSIFDLPDFKNFDGVVYVRNTFQNSTIDKDIIERIEKSGTPCVCIDSYHPSFVNICSDERGLMEAVTNHLIDVHGCKRLYFLGGQHESTDTVARLQGFKDALTGHSLSFDDEWLLYGDFEYSSGVDAAGYFLNLSSELPDAIVCANDEMAVGLIQELKRRGVKVPREVKVAGIDFDSVSRVYSPSITTAKRQQYQKGANAINILHEFSEHKSGETITLPIALACGYSCGCKPEEDNKNDAATINALAVDKYAQAELVQTTRRMTASLMGKRDQYALLDGIRDFADELNPDELYICMNVRPDYIIDYSDYAKALALIDRDNQADYSDDMICVVSSTKEGSSDDSQREYFEKADLFPPQAHGGKVGGTYYFYPVHYMNRNFGYAILGTSGELIRNDYFPNFCNITSNALENTRKICVMQQMISALDRMWIYDTLTGIYNRAGFFKLSESIVNESIQKGTSVCVIFMDVDGLKEVNDHFGHDLGDDLIKTVADILKEIKHHGEIIMRYGGDEFVLLASGYTDDDAKNTIKKIEAAMTRVNEQESKPYFLDASIGYCITALKNSDQLNALIEDADHEMYKVKYVKKTMKRKPIK